MKKFIGFLALMVLSISFSAMGLDPPRDHTTHQGYEIVISDAFELPSVTYVMDYQATDFDVMVLTDQPPGLFYEFGYITEAVQPPTLCSNAIKQRPWEPPGILYEFGIQIESVFPSTLTDEMQQNSLAILYVTDQLSELPPENIHNNTKYKRTDKLSEATFWNYVLFRSDRSQYV